jgi:hypothetical protein
MKDDTLFSMTTISSSSTVIEEVERKYLGNHSSRRDAITPSINGKKFSKIS